MTGELVEFFHERTDWIHDQVVDEGHRSQGHGEQLLAVVTGWAADPGCGTVGLVSRLTNADATAFYDDTEMERFGYLFGRDV